VLLAPVSILSFPPQGAIPGKLLYRVQPVYPRQALAARLEGPVVLQGVIAEDGRVRDLKVVSGEPLLAQAAINSLSQWIYQPYRLEGKPASVPTEITVSFRLP
jgi:TonB family protein